MVLKEELEKIINEGLITKFTEHQVKTLCNHFFPKTEPVIEMPLVEVYILSYGQVQKVKDFLHNTCSKERLKQVEEQQNQEYKLEDGQGIGNYAGICIPLTDGYVIVVADKPTTLTVDEAIEHELLHTIEIEIMLLQKEGVTLKINGKIYKPSEPFLIHKGLELRKS